jgi:hypothetical protein
LNATYYDRLSSPTNFPTLSEGSIAVYRFTAGSSGTYSFTLTDPISPIDQNILIFISDIPITLESDLYKVYNYINPYDLIASIDNQGGILERDIFINSGSTYYLAAYCIDGGSSTPQPYTLNITLRSG